jgi:hypothetical protein
MPRSTRHDVTLGHKIECTVTKIECTLEYQVGRRISPLNG